MLKANAIRKGLGALAAAVLASHVNGVAAEDSVVPLDRFLSPPFSSLKIAPPADPGTINFPQLQAGQVVLYFVTAKGQIRAESCSPMEQAVVQPNATQRMQLAAIANNLQVAKQSHQLLVAASASQNRSATGRVALVEAISSNDFAAQKSQARLTLAATTNALATQATATHVATGNLRSETQTAASKSQLSTSESDAKLASVNDAMQTQAITRDRSTVTSQESGKIVAMAHSKGGLARLLDTDFLAAWIEEGAALLGFDEEGMLFETLDADEIATLQEAEAQWVEIMTNADFSQSLDYYLNGLATARFRSDYIGTGDADTDDAVALKVSCHLIPAAGESGLYHGHPFAFSIIVENTGPTPAFDMLILSAPPEHAEFLQMPASARGSMFDYVADRNWIVTRVFLPLQPGRKFGAQAIEVTDPWYIN